jgi:hypothetical protein
MHLKLYNLHAAVEAAADDARDWREARLTKQHASKLPGNDDFHDLVFQQNDACGDDEHKPSADGVGGSGNKEKHGNFLRAGHGGMTAIKIKNRPWRCALAHVSSNYGLNRAFERCGSRSGAPSRNGEHDHCFCLLNASKPEITSKSSSSMPL